MPNPNINNFDDFFRARLGNQEMAVAPDMFDRIMRERKRRKPIFWWSWTTPQKLLAGSALVLSASLLGWYALAHQQKNENMLSDYNNINSASPQAPIPNNAPKLLPNLQTEKKVQNVQENLTSSTQSNSFTLSKKNISNFPLSKTTLIRGKDLEKMEVRIDKNTSLDKPQMVAADATQIPDKATNQNENQVSPPPSVTDNLNNFETSLPEKYIENQFNKPNSTGLTMTKIDNLDFLAIKDLSLLSAQSFQTPNNLQGVLDEGCKSFNRKKKKLPNPSNWFLDVYASPDYAMRRLKNVSGDFENYIQARDSTEARWYAFSAGARISRVFSTGIAVRGGLHYAQINEIFDYKQPDYTKITRTTVEIRDVSGALIRVDTVETVEIGLRRRTDYNRYRSLDLPLQVGYEQYNKKITWSANVGVNLNLYSWQSGKLLNENLMPTDAATSQTFRTQVGLSAFASVACYISMGRQWQWLIEPNIRHQIGSWTRQTYPIRQDYTTIGLFTGVRYRFVKKKRIFF